MSRKNGGIIGPANTPVGGLFKGVAGGVWRMNDVANFVGNSQWPKVPENIDNSLRFERSSSDYLSKTFGSGGNRKTATQSFWLKRSLLSTNMMLGLTNYPSGSYYGIQALTDDVLDIYLYYNGSAWEGRLKTNRVFRDVSSWYHFVLAWDTTQSTASDRLKFYVNGVQETSFSVETYPDQNQDLDWNNNIAHQINSGGGGAFSGYLAEMVFIDGQQLDPTSFAEFDTTTGIWKPKKIGQIANAGTNSFYLDFKDSSNVGNDASGLNNDFTVNNLTSIDQATDTCVVNFAVLNALHKVDDWSLAEGNLKFTNNSSGHRMTNSTLAVNTGKWYAEVKVNTLGGTYPQIGVINPDVFTYNTYLGASSKGYGYLSNGQSQFNNTAESFGNSYTTGDIIGIAMDLDNHKLYFSKNGTFQNSGDPTSGSTGTGATYNLATGVFYSFGQSSYDSGTDPVYSWNFGNPPFAISSGNSDANGFGNFEYPVPSGYYALNTSNLNTYG
jgi:hypothetical protein